MTDHQIDTDGITVWINGAHGLIGRFGKQGIDIHREPSEQQSLGECLHCTHGTTTAEDWDVFVVKMKELYGIEVPATYKPWRFRDRE